MHFQVLPAHKIDRQKWDDCIKKSSNSLIYASSAYLDYMADNWHGIIADDYSYIMPVPWRKKFGIRYSYSVPFIQQLGLYGKDTSSEKNVNFLNCLSSFCKYGDYAFNYAQNMENIPACSNYILPLSARYDLLSQFYSSNLNNNLAKASKNSIKYLKGMHEEAIHLFQRLYAHRFRHVLLSSYKSFTALCILKEKENNLIVRKICKDNETLAITLLLKDEKRLYNLMPSVTENGRKQSAGHYLFNCIIKEFAQSGLILDFEGSDIHGIQLFYKSFGAINQPYYKLHFNHLPFPLHFFKR